MASLEKSSRYLNKNLSHSFYIFSPDKRRGNTYQFILNIDNKCITGEKIINISKTYRQNLKLNTKSSIILKRSDTVSKRDLSQECKVLLREETNECYIWHQRIKVQKLHDQLNAGTHVDSLQSCPTLCDPMDYSLSGSSVHGIFQARILEWVVISSSKDGEEKKKLTLFHGEKWIN